MVYHLVDGHGQRGRVANHHIRSRVANKNAVDTSTVYDTGCRKIIGGKHRYLLPLLFHLNKTVRRHLACIAH